MGKTLREKMAELNRDRRDRIEAEADRLHKEWASRTLQAPPSVPCAQENGPDSAEDSEMSPFR